MVLEYFYHLLNYSVNVDVITPHKLFIDSGFQIGNYLPLYSTPNRYSRLRCCFWYHYISLTCVRWPQLFENFRMYPSLDVLQTDIIIERKQLKLYCWHSLWMPTAGVPFKACYNEIRHHIALKDTVIEPSDGSALMPCLPPFSCAIQSRS